MENFTQGCNGRFAAGLRSTHRATALKRGPMKCYSPPEIEARRDPSVALI
jgi:hypothetical protein